MELDDENSPSDLVPLGTLVFPLPSVERQHRNTRVAGTMPNAAPRRDGRVQAASYAGASSHGPRVGHGFG